MLIIAILLNLGCSILLRKYDLRKYVDAFKARRQTSVKKNKTTESNKWNVLYLILIKIDKAKCLFQRKITTMMLNDVNVNDIHFWNNKYDHPEEYLCTNKIRVIYFYSN